MSVQYNSMKPTKYSLLDAREKTDRFEKSLLKKFSDKTLVVIRCNIPGEKKGSIESNWIVYVVFLEAEKRFSPLHIFHSYTEEEGLIFFLLVEQNGISVKRIAVEIEDMHQLGRLADIDVLNAYKLFSRSDLSELPKSQNRKRKCFLCGNPAIICVRSEAHPKIEILNFICKKVYDCWFFNNTDISCKNSENKLLNTLAVLTEAAMLSELCRVHGFGCVTANGKGSHNDMDFLLMLKCIPVAGDAVRNLTIKDCMSFSALRNYGKKIEKKLFTITDGVNTYKGAFFLLLILNACVYKMIFAKKNIASLRSEIAEFSQEVKKDFYTRNCSTVSLNAFLQTGECGVRGTVLSGFYEHFDQYLPMFKNGENIKKIILMMISQTYDTTIINRKGELKLNELKEKVKTLLPLFDDLAAAHKLDEMCSSLSYWCENENISTGGTADKLIVLYFLYLVDKFQKPLCELTY